jgi:hypothetical protein
MAREDGFNMQAGLNGDRFGSDIDPLLVIKGFNKI